MNETYKLIIEGISSKKIDKELAISLLKKLKSTKRANTEDIAITGISLEFPGASSVKDFWDNINNNVSNFGKLKELRIKDIRSYLSSYMDIEYDKLKFLNGSYLDEIDKFDYEFFNISPQEASLMDPSQRLFLQNAWKVIEDAGYCKEEIRGSKTGVYIGYSGSSDYQSLIYKYQPDLLPISMVGNMAAIMPSRISYILDLKGPAMAIDCACSASSVAIHLACQAIQNGDCDMAIAGSVRLNIFPVDNDNIKIGLESESGITNSFDNNSNGASIGEGVAAIFLKPLSKAKQEKDNIYAVIKGSAINQDGNSIGITAPNPSAQAEVIESAWKASKISPEDIAYIEAHGTSTNLGDTIEVEGISRAFLRYTDKKQFCALSSVKTNIGHLYECSGIAGIIKSALSLKNKVIPSSLNFKMPNTNITFESSPLYVNVKSRKWESNNKPRICAVNSFGLSGTNCHIVLEEAPFKENIVFDNKKYHVLTISAKTKDQVILIVKEYLNNFKYITENSTLEDICYTSNCCRTHFNCRLAIIVNSIEDLYTKLKEIEKLDLKIVDEKFYFYNECDINKYKNDNELEIEEKEGGLKNVKEVNNLLNLRNICELYIKGADISWIILYNIDIVYKAHIPTYPFKKNTCWVNVPKDKGSDVVENIFGVSWKLQDSIEYVNESTNGIIIIFEDEKGIAKQVEKQLLLKGLEIICIKFGDTFEKVDRSNYIIRGTEEDYLKLLSDLDLNMLTKIIHLSTITEHNDINDLNNIRKCKYRGVLSLFLLIKTISNCNIRSNIDILIISEYINRVSKEDKLVIPENSILPGFGKVVNKEFKYLKCRTLDIDEEISIKNIVDEINLNTSNYLIAYRKRKKYIQEFGVIDDGLVSNLNTNIRQDGIYVITGGLGGIGIEIAKYLSSKNKANIALINRRDFPSRDKWSDVLRENDDEWTCAKIKLIQEIEATGSNVLCCQGNVANEKEMNLLFRELRKNYGNINGVIHSAGISDDKLILERSFDDIDKILLPKIDGTYILDKVTEEDDMQFFILFSSVATIFSTIRQSDYVAANSYMDSFCKNRNMRGKRTIAINWTTWKETGMAFDSGFTVDTIFKTLSTKDAIKAFDWVINRNIDNVLIGDINYKGGGIYLLKQSGINLNDNIWRKINEYEKQSNSRLQSLKLKSNELNKHVELKGRDSEEYSSMEKKIAQVWGEKLGYSEIGINDNYYELGGNSIIGMKIVNDLEKILLYPVNIVDILRNPTIYKLAKYLCEDQKNITKRIYPSMIKAKDEEYYPASSSQKRMYVINEIDESNTSYNISRFVLIEGEFDVNRFESSVREIVKRHEVLRTSLKLIDGELVQKIHNNLEFDINYMETNESDIEFIIKSFVKPFNLNFAPLFRVGLVRLEKKKYIMLVDMHHSITDGVSMDIFINEFAELYKGKKLKPLEYQYKDYSIWQQRLLSSEIIKEQEEYWLNRFKDRGENLHIPIDFPRPSMKNLDGCRVTNEVSKELTEKVKKIAAETGTTLYMLLLTNFYVLLSKCTVQEDITIGSPITGRPIKELNNIIGMFVNTVAMRNFPKKDKTLKEFLNEVKQNSIDAYYNQDYQFEELVSKLGVKRDLSNNPLFNTMFILQNVGTRKEYFDEFKWRIYETDITTSIVDIFLEIYEIDDMLEIHMEYCTKLFRRETIEKMLMDYLDLLKRLENNLNLTIGDITLKSSSTLIQDDIEEHEEDDDIKFNF